MHKPALVRRQAAVIKVQARFDGKSFLLGRRDCVTLSAVLLRALGHTVPKVPPYKTDLAAARALKSQGVNDLAGLIDKLGLERIAPASALLGDLLFLPGADEVGNSIGALVIAIGNGAGMGFHQDHRGLVRMRDMDVQAAWKTLP